MSVGLWIAAVPIGIAQLWLLLFVVPALFNAHTSAGLAAAILLALAVPVAMAAEITSRRRRLDG
ncbi:MAG: hypothetical protein K2W81_04400 [Sphingomonas sp.]|uniref:hypothetical protein n=1 Tax=Sphingomonas sp. TaxID=28214 RepID=UPI0025FD15C6|nr:hypothetical protein [Sphingomonas sp.]MBY0283188.1 hypothetical protein [Sphingomonas sp.]